MQLTRVALFVRIFPKKKKKCNRILSHDLRKYFSDQNRLPWINLFQIARELYIVFETFAKENLSLVRLLLYLKGAETNLGNFHIPGFISRCNHSLALTAGWNNKCINSCAISKLFHQSYQSRIHWQYKQYQKIMVIEIYKAAAVSDVDDVIRLLGPGYIGWLFGVFCLTNNVFRCFRWKLKII